MGSSTIILVFCLVAFATIHSLTASLPFKRFIMRVVGPGAERYYMPVYSLIAFVTIAPLVYLLIKNPGQVLYIVPSPWRWPMVGGQLIAAIVAPRAMFDAPHRFKLRSQLAAPKTPEAGPLNIRGIYRWIRDPFLLSGLVIMWLMPFMTVNLLVIYILSTIYLYLGSLHWESRLVSQFGDEYREYQKKVHRIIPHSGGYR
ncbi:protein-S-isoprenylcysteine methyltransferase [Methanosarcina sp. 2.H.T.1A.6]|uniref:NnrU family protein n=1 Tax=unclassified Methanosarcina TaxID=2644672 RepID=UPI0006221B15|nr:MULTISPECIES: isoprenylcysteine carboxylmethyltransferase family protein [unclassified Methanosarcina]KKG17264.1 protein-S-isoprenylcysteine methyltransferase [Methanosarcina sp. 2.H.T.1A.3]KKG24105.1 protein-S-isoprenylcysteine methyltransferase [Methanosarcina sp. 2.H.T.1A.6]KKG26571.1 protein-S-isoprenylcysteine methyltransferase [Methanosarcina sp. 2.H.T.1A.8]KKG27470.1 protein-S-isoprenylcysteine methyltransferase [Methanosarcina sp. 2.H.T.1A.15]